MIRPRISVKGLDFYYQKKQVVFDLNLDIPKNEIFTVFGPANSGITTLLRSMNRLYELIPGARMKGKILLDGKDIHSKDIDKHELRRKVGMVFDVPTPLPMTVFDNVAYGLRLSGVKNKEAISERVEEALKMAALWDDVKDRLDVSGISLSGGQQQRLCIARALALQPEVILLDKPCSGLDPISTAKIEDSLKKLKKKFTIVITPHNIQQAMRISDRAAFMLMGHLIEEGAAKDVFENPRDERTRDYITGKFG